MRMNQGVEWAVHACTVLAPLYPGHGLPLAALAEFHGVPAPYMAKQMQALSASGLVRTSRGRSGGYALARDPKEITLADIAVAIDGAAPAFRCTEIRQRGPCAAPRADCTRLCHIAAAFGGAERAWLERLTAISIADLGSQVISDSNSAHITRAARW